MTESGGSDLGRKYAEAMFTPRDLTPNDQAMIAALLADPVELVLRKHLPVPVRDTSDVLCICDVTQTYEGPVGQRLHVVDELRKAGLLRDR